MSENLKEILIEGYNDKQLNKPCKDWFPSYKAKQAYLLGNSLAIDRIKLTEELAEQYVNGLG